MIRQFVLAAALLAAWYPWGELAAAPQGEIIPETTAARHGLTRPWFTQIQMDRSRARVRHVVLHEGTLYVETNRAMVHVIDAETGETLWAKQIGRPDHPSLTPAVAEDLLAVVNGSRLYVANRHNGKLLCEIGLKDAPGAGPCLSRRRAYVPMVSGMLVAYRLEPLVDPLEELGKINPNPTAEEIAAAEEDRRENLRLRQEAIPPLLCHSQGRALVQPLVTRETATEEFVTWATDRGYLYAASIDLREEDSLSVQWRLETAVGIAARPTYYPPDPGDPADSGVILGASRDGYVHAIRERDGEPLWRFPTGEPILQPAVVIDERVYVATQPGGMHCLSVVTGERFWWAPQIRQFVAASKQRVYATDKLGRLLTLSAQTGARLDMLPVGHLPIKLLNSDTDRLYLGTDTGLIQCLHERELVEPLHHGRTRQEKPAEKPPDGQQKGAEEPASDQPGGRLPPAGENEDPFT